MILVAGSTGMLGSTICQKLVEQGKQVRALVRESSDAGKVARLTALGVTAVKGDLRDPASLQTACQGVETVIDTVSAIPFSFVPGQNDLELVDTQGCMALVDAAKAAGVKQIIYTSFSGNIAAEFPLSNAKRAAEAYVRASGLTYTILRPGYFMEGWLSPMVGFDPANAKATIYGSGDQLINWISLFDVASYAVEAIGNPAARNAVLELGGPHASTLKTVIGLFEKQGGKAFEVTQVPAEALKVQLDAAPDPFNKSFAGLMYCYAMGDPIDMTNILKTFAVKPLAIEDYVQRALPKA